MFRYLFALSLFSTGAYACTDFVLQDSKGQVVNARSMEFGPDLQSEITLFPRGEEWSSISGPDKIQMSWTTKYSALGIIVYGLNIVADGMNEKGLSLGTLWFPGAQYPQVKWSRPTSIINIEEVALWILTSFATVEEVKEAMRDMQIYAHRIPQFNGTPPTHISIHDAKGENIVIEFIKGVMQISDNPNGVLTNAPKFEWQMTNLSNYVNLSAMNRGSVKFNGSVLNPTGQGSGLLGLPGDWTPPSRFVKISVLKDFVKKAKNSRENVTLAFHMLNTVDIPYGAIQSEKTEDFDHTQWIVVKDLSNNQMHYRTYDDLNIRIVDLDTEMTIIRKPQKKIPLDRL